jgi:hypothetical protein
LGKTCKPVIVVHGGIGAAHILPNFCWVYMTADQKEPVASLKAKFLKQTPSKWQPNSIAFMATLKGQFFREKKRTKNSGFTCSF